MGTRYFNFLRHLEQNYPTELRPMQTRSFIHYKHGLFSFLYCQNVTLIFVWLCYVTHCLRPFSIMQSASIRTHIRYRSVTLNILKRYMSTSTNFVQHNISSRLPDHFKIVFDSHATLQTYYVTVSLNIFLEAL